jgi:hypothetical protein
MQNNLETAVLETIVYFDLFSYPLTTLELWQNLGVKASYHEVYDMLEQSEFLHNRLKKVNGMWMLNDENVVERQENYRVSKAKLAKARQFAKRLKRIPWIKDIFVCNSLGYLNSRRESDIDFFIVAKRGRIWQARFFSILLSKIFGKRPNRNTHQDTLCLSFFAVDGADMKRVAIDNDLYYQSWMTKVMPLVDSGVSKFLERNRWVKIALPQARAIVPPKSLVISNKEGGSNWKLGNIMEKALRRLQLRIMPSNLKTVANQGTAVVLNDTFLKFHDHDRRSEIKKQFATRLSEVLA